MRETCWTTIFAITAAFALAVAGLSLSAGSALAAPAYQDEEPEEIEFTGTVTAINGTDGTLEVEVETDDDGTVSYTVLVPDDFDLGELSIGDTVEVEGTLDEDGLVVASKVQLEDAEEDEDDGEEDGEEDGEDDDDGDADGENFFCANPDESHPVGQSIADSHDLSYEEVMAWFCEGNFGFGQIMLALHTAEITGDSADDLLGRRAGGEGWGQIWQDLDLIGRPEDAGPPEGKGRPEDAGPPEDHGRPEDAGPPEDHGRPEWAGPPEDRGRPDWAGPPDRGD